MRLRFEVTEERIFPQVKLLLEQAAAGGLRPMPSHHDYTEGTAANGVAITGGGGISFKMNSALAFRSEFSYQQSWLRPLWGHSFSSALRFSTGLILRMGTW